MRTYFRYLIRDKEGNKHCIATIGFNGITPVVPRINEYVNLERYINSNYKQNFNLDFDNYKIKKIEYTYSTNNFSAVADEPPVLYIEFETVGEYNDTRTS